MIIAASDEQELPGQVRRGDGQATATSTQAQPSTRLSTRDPRTPQPSAIAAERRAGRRPPMTQPAAHGAVEEADLSRFAAGVPRRSRRRRRAGHRRAGPARPRRATGPSRMVPASSRTAERHAPPAAGRGGAAARPAPITPTSARHQADSDHAARCPARRRPAHRSASASPTALTMAKQDRGREGPHRARANRARCRPTVAGSADAERPCVARRAREVSPPIGARSSTRAGAAPRLVDRPVASTAARYRRRRRGARWPTRSGSAASTCGRRPMIAVRLASVASAIRPPWTPPAPASGRRVPAVLSIRARGRDRRRPGRRSCERARPSRPALASRTRPRNASLAPARHHDRGRRRGQALVDFGRLLDAPQ